MATLKQQITHPGSVIVSFDGSGVFPHIPAPDDGTYAREIAAKYGMDDKAAVEYVAHLRGKYHAHNEHPLASASRRIANSIQKVVHGIPLSEPVPVSMQERKPHQYTLSAFGSPYFAPPVIRLPEENSVPAPVYMPYVQVEERQISSSPRVPPIMLPDIQGMHADDIRELSSVLTSARDRGQLANAEAVTMLCAWFMELHSIHHEHFCDVVRVACQYTECTAVEPIEWPVLPVFAGEPVHMPKDIALTEDTRMKIWVNVGIIMPNTRELRLMRKYDAYWRRMARDEREAQKEKKRLQMLALAESRKAKQAAVAAVRPDSVLPASEAVGELSAMQKESQFSAEVVTGWADMAEDAQDAYIAQLQSGQFPVADQSSEGADLFDVITEEIVESSAETPDAVQAAVASDETGEVLLAELLPDQARDLRAFLHRARALGQLNRDFIWSTCETIFHSFGFDMTLLDQVVVQLCTEFDVDMHTVSAATVGHKVEDAAVHDGDRLSLALQPGLSEADFLRLYTTGPAKMNERGTWRIREAMPKDHPSAGLVTPKPILRISDDDDDVDTDGLDDIDGASDYEYEDDEVEPIDFDALGIDPSAPTQARPGSEEKVLMLAARYHAGLPLWHDKDCYDQAVS